MKYRLFGALFILFFLAWRTLDGLVEGIGAVWKADFRTLVCSSPKACGLPTGACLRPVHIQCANRTSNSSVLLVILA